MSDDLPMPATEAAKPSGHAASAAVTAAPAPRRAGRRRALMLALPVALAAAAGWYVLNGGRYEETDNASLHQARLLVAPDVGGRVTESRVHEGGRVAKGDVMFVVDREPLAIALAQADAAVASARLQVTGLQAAWRLASSKLEIAREDLAFRESEAQRQDQLTRRGVGTQSARDETNHALETARQSVTAAEAEVQNAAAALGGQPEGAVDGHPLVRQAQAARDDAALTLARAEVRAPADGVVTQASSFRPGQFVSAGTPVFSLMVTGQTWIEANFKETQLASIAPGQPATVAFDAFPGRDFTAEVETIAPGTGAEFSLLPAQNATGNWVKVTQRVPVRLLLSEGQDIADLRSGLSATVTVDTRRQTRLQSLEGRLGALAGRDAGH